MALRLCAFALKISFALKNIFKMKSGIQTIFTIAQNTLPESVCDDRKTESSEFRVAVGFSAYIYIEFDII